MVKRPRRSKVVKGEVFKETSDKRTKILGRESGGRSKKLEKKNITHSVG